jgi:hypothetical protein
MLSSTLSYLVIANRQCFQQSVRMSKDEDITRLIAQGYTRDQATYIAGGNVGGSTPTASNQNSNSNNNNNNNFINGSGHHRSSTRSSFDLNSNVCNIQSLSMVMTLSYPALFYFSVSRWRRWWRRCHVCWFSFHLPSIKYGQPRR